MIISSINIIMEEQVLDYVKETGIRSPLKIKEALNLKTPTNKIRKIINKLEVVQVFKTKHTKFYKRFTETYPNNHWQMDLVDMSMFNSPYNWMLQIIDIYSRYLFSIPLKRKSAVATFNAFKSAVEKMENPPLRRVIQKAPKNPNKISTDNGVEFKNRLFKSYTEKHYIKHQFAQKDDHQAQSIVERVNKTITHRLVMLMGQKGHSKWTDFHEKVVRGYNHSLHSTINDTPRNAYKNLTILPIPQIEIPTLKLNQKVRYRIHRNVFSKRKPIFSSTTHTIEKIKSSFYYIRIDDKLKKFRINDLQPIDTVIPSKIKKIIKENNNRRDQRNLDRELNRLDPQPEPQKRIIRKPRRYR